MFLVILFLMGAALLCLFVKVKGEEKNIVNVPIDLSQVRDGEYEGHSETTLVKVDVKVVVEGENIQDIQLIRHVCGKGEPANAMLDTMIQENINDVDTVSGATMSSKVIKNAVNDAQENTRKQENKKEESKGWFSNLAAKAKSGFVSIM